CAASQNVGMPSTKAGGAASPAMTLYFDDVPVRNQLLAALDVAVLDGIKPHFSTVRIAPPVALFGADGSIGDVYFPETAIVSVVNTVHGRSVEVDAVGNDGMAGLHVFLNDTDSTARAFALGSGVVRRMAARVYTRLFAVPPFQAHFTKSCCGTRERYSRAPRGPRRASPLICCSNALRGGCSLPASAAARMSSHLRTRFCRSSSASATTVSRWRCDRSRTAS